MNSKINSTLNGIGTLFIYITILNLAFLQPSSLFRNIELGGLILGLKGTLLFLLSRLKR